MIVWGCAESVASCLHRPTPPCTPSHCPGNGPSHVAVIIPTIPVAAITAMTSTSEAPRANAFSPWDGNNMPPEGPEAWECLAGPCRRVGVASAIAPWGGKGELTVLGGEGPT
jgi:hypothetical protein